MRKRIAVDPEGGKGMKKNRYAEPVRQTYADKSKRENFKFKDRNGSNNMPGTSKKKKRKKKGPKTAR